MNPRPEKQGVWEVFRRYYLLPATLLWIGLLAVVLIVNRVDEPEDPAQGIQGLWDWSDSTIFEFQRVSLRFQADSFFMIHRFMNPQNPESRLPCSQPDYQQYASGKFSLDGDSLLRFDGNFTDYLFSRDTLKLCRDTGFRASTRMKLSGDTLCLKGEAFASGLCFTNVGGRE
jgi:hypothetical protein